MSLLTVTANTQPLPFMPSKNKLGEIKPVSSDSLFGGITNDLAELIAPAYTWGITIITILFVIGTVVMILSMIFKNGLWQKYGQGTMSISFLVMLMLRGLPIIILSVQSSADFSKLLSDSLAVLNYAAILLGLAGVAISFLFKFGHKLIGHPDFHRWSRNLLSVSIIMTVFAIVIPVIFPTI